MVPFFGNVVSDQGILPDPKKVQSIKNWPSPKSPKELQSFLGAVNYLSMFIPELSSLRSPLQGLVKKDSEYLWTGTLQVLLWWNGLWDDDEACFDIIVGDVIGTFGVSK